MIEWETISHEALVEYIWSFLLHATLGSVRSSRRRSTILFWAKTLWPERRRRSSWTSFLGQQPLFSLSLYLPIREATGRVSECQTLVRRQSTIPFAHSLFIYLFDWAHRGPYRQKNKQTWRVRTVNDTNRAVYSRLTGWYKTRQHIATTQKTVDSTTCKRWTYNACAR